MLRLEGLRCGYGPIEAVHGLDLEVPARNVTALIGANGAGKTSTILAIAGHVQSSHGRLFLGSEDISNLSPKLRVRRGIALVPEGRRLFSDLTVTENLVVGGYSRPRTSETRNREKVFDLFPRLAERRNQLAVSLSGGEQQMLAIGRALMAEPRFLMIDELSLGLMPKMVDLCYAAVRRLKAEGLTILIVEQSTTRALAVADHVTVLTSGEAAWQGPAEEARRDPALMDHYLGMRVRSAEH